MIYYNFPYRGPFEYDKFIISILQYCNEAENILEIIERDEKGFLAKCKGLDDELVTIRRENHAERLLGIIEMIV
ncbi:hypothetical protein [Lysinibacillus pakistanensis]|uniref:hypothetical protein n=1 Tax=Lysinibacillus pakistanensis TaxID=759811 RepID=UPI003D2DB7AE